MSRRFLNTEQRMRIIQALVLKDLLINNILAWKSLKYSKEATKYLKSSHTFLDKSIDLLLKEIGYEEAKKIKDIADDTYFIYGSKKSRSKTYHEEKKEPCEKIITDNDTVYDVMEAVIEQYCKKCSGKKEHCNIRDNFMVPWEAPPANEVTDDLKNECPFSYDSDVEVIREG